MRRFTFNLLLFAFAMSATAQQAHHLGNIRKTKQAVSMNFTAKQAKSVAASGIITEQPEGVVYDNLYRSSDYYYNEEGYCSASSEDGLVGQIVEGNDGCLYIFNPFSGFPTNTWAKAERAEGDTVIIKGHQPIYALEGGEVDSLDIFDITETAVGDDEEGYYYTFTSTYSPVQEAKFIWKNGTLTSVDDKVLGISTSSYDNPGTWEWAKVGDYNYSFKPVTEEVETLPEDVVFKPYKFHNDRHNSYSDPVVLNVGFLGDDVVYLQLDSTIATGWVKGYIEGNTLTFPSHQYLGSNNSHGRHLFFMAGYSTQTYNEDWKDYVTNYYFADKITFTYNPEDQSFSSDSIMYENSGDNFVYYYVKNSDMSYTPFKEVAATPADPIIHMGPEVVRMDDGIDPFTSYFIDLETPFVDTDSTFINPNKLYYNVFIDDDLYTFKQSEYPTLPGDLTDVPVLLHDGLLVGMYGRFHMVNFSNDALFFDTDMNPIVNKVGVQMVYKGSNEVHKSNIVWWDVAAGAVVDDGMENKTFSGHTHATRVVYYDLMGRRVSAPAHGIFIKKEACSDGKVKTSKVALK